jgi:hypothetical protein
MNPPNWKDATRIFRRGDLIRIRYKDREVEGVVLIASENGNSLMLAFDALLGGYIGTMPVLWDGEEFRDLLTRTIVEIESE